MSSNFPVLREPTKMSEPPFSLISFVFQTSWRGTRVDFDSVSVVLVSCLAIWPSFVTGPRIGAVRQKGRALHPPKGDEAGEAGGGCAKLAQSRPRSGWGQSKEGE